MPSLLPILHECHDCGLFNRLPAPVAGMNIGCVRCDASLRQVGSGSLAHGLAWTGTALMFYVLAVLAPMLTVGLYGHYRSGGLDSGPLALDDQGFWILAALVFLTTIFMPLVKILGTFVVLAALHYGQRPRWLAGLYALVRHLKSWVMVEVYLLGFLVAYSRLDVMATVHVALAVAGLAGLMLSMMAMDTHIDAEAVWEQIRARRPVDMTLPRQRWVGCDTCFQVSAASADGANCPRCGEMLRARKPDSMSRAWALTIGAAFLYIPSNIYPVMIVTKLGKTQPYTIFTGLKELAHVGLWPLAVLVFIASIAIPVFKLVMLGYMLGETQRGSAARMQGRTRLYRLLDFIGRWSMVDIFVVSILASLIRFGWFAQISAGMGAIYFAGVVVLTLMAVKSFDPRLMWDAAPHASPASISLTAAHPAPNVAA